MLSPFEAPRTVDRDGMAPMKGIPAPPLSRSETAMTIDAPVEEEDAAKELSPQTCGKRLQATRPWPAVSPPAVA